MYNIIDEITINENGYHMTHLTTTPPDRIAVLETAP